jgi:hypothetical protein
MPIRKEHREYYRKAHRQFRLQLIEEAGGEICSRCRIELGGGINLAHLDHDPRSTKNRVLLCPSCHAANDARHCLAIQRRRKAASTGQLWLTPEMEWAPFAKWEIPGWVADRLHQLGLFSD